MSEETASSLEAVMRRPPFRPLTVVAVAAALAASACGGSSGPSVPKDPHGELTASIGNLADSDVLTATLKLETTAADLRRFAAEGGDKLPAADAQAIASARLVIETATANGDPLSEVKPGDRTATDASIRAITNGTTLVEIRTVGGDIYLHGDVKAILDVIHQSKAYEEVQARAASLPPFVQAAVAGKWVSINGSAAQGLVDTFGGGKTPSSSQGQQLLGDLKRIMQQDVEVRRIGTDERGDHLRLTGNTRRLATDFLAALSTSVPGGSAALSQLDPKDVPNRSITVDAWVDDGVLSELSVDLVQFAEPGEVQPGDHLPIALTFEQSGDDIGKPSDVTPVDLTQLGALLGALSST